MNGYNEEEMIGMYPSEKLAVSGIVQIEFISANHDFSEHLEELIGFKTGAVSFEILQFRCTCGMKQSRMNISQNCVV
jgi:hypothetical protein